jgi:predicted RNase H-like nuclease (RuvC/YqgF family)
MDQQHTKKYNLLAEKMERQRVTYDSQIVKLQVRIRECTMTIQTLEEQLEALRNVNQLYNDRSNECNGLRDHNNSLLER